MKSVIRFSAIAALSCGVVSQTFAAGNAYVEAIKKINEAHARKPGTTKEDELAKKLPRSAELALKKLLAAKASDKTSEALLACGEAALDLARIYDFQSIRKRLLEIDQDVAASLGDAVVRDQLVIRGIGELEDGYLDNFAELAEGIMGA